MTRPHPALLLIALLLLVGGCGSIRAVRGWVFKDKSIDGKDKIEYAKVIEENEAKFREYKEKNRPFMFFHYMAGAMFLGGVALAILGKTTKDEAAIACFSALALSSWAFLAPKYVTIPIGTLGCFIILLITLIVAEYNNRKPGGTV